ncbi:MAG TPA: Hpt domain-containing protein [Bacteroidia bacterium]|jgi:HPt (histidine-containing phosphotransfer) domain-containing protein|nr:Hpt domain-containing protein [Bacteroidia bacterium]
MRNEISRSFNLDELKGMSNGDEKFITEMVTVFIKTTGEGMKKIESALKEKNLKVIASEVHKIAPPCRHMGAMELLHVLKKIQSNLHTSGSVTDLENLVLQARQKADIVMNDLKNEVN